MFLGIVVVALATLIVAGAAGIYNQLIVLRGRCRNAFAPIDLQLRRRYDLIPNLVERVKGDLAREGEGLDRVIAARAAAATARKHAGQAPGAARPMAELICAESELRRSLGGLMAAISDTPAIAGNENVSQILSELSSNDEKIARSRQIFNAAATAYNGARGRFPHSLIASCLGLQSLQIFGDS